MVSITLERLVKRFGPTVAVDGVDLRIERGELFFLLGPSGCGKTTLMRMIAGLTEADGGRVVFDDRDVTGVETGRRNTALVFQSYALWPHMTVAENVAFGLEVRGVGGEARRRRVDEMLGLVRMEGMADRRPGQLSGGQQQRVALARALVVGPDVLLLDEPLSNLDAKLRQEMRREIRRICRESGVTGVYVTHDQEEALSVADRIAVMRAGRVEQVGTPGELYGRPRSRFVADFLGRANFFEGTVQRCEGGMVWIETAAGVMRGRLEEAGHKGQAGHGERVTCMVRPERVRLLEAGREGAAAVGMEGLMGLENVVEVRHVETVFLGHYAEHHVEAGGGVVMSVEEMPGRPWQGAISCRAAFGADDLVIVSD